MTDTAGSSWQPEPPTRRAAARRAVVPEAPRAPGDESSALATEFSPARSTAVDGSSRRGASAPTSRRLARAQASATSDQAPDRVSPKVLAPLAAAVWWFVGFLPWLLSGFHDEVRPSDPALEAGVGEHGLAVPLITMHLADLVLGGLVGGLAAGSLGLLCARRGQASRLTAMGVAIGLVTALVVTWLQLVGAGDDLFAQEPQVIGGLAAVLVGSTLVGWLLGALGAARGMALAVSAAVLAGACTPWLSAAMHATHVDVTVLEWVPNAPSWLGAVALAAVLGLVGVSPLTRLLWWPVAFGAAYVVWPVLNGHSRLAPELRPGTTADAMPALIGQAVHSARHALMPSERLMLPWGMALCLGLMIAIVLELVRDSRLDPPPTVPED